jgi:hypothetical protein
MKSSVLSAFRCRACAILGAALLSTAAANAAECETPDGPIAVKVRVDEGRVRMITTAGIAEVTVKAGLPTSSGARGGQHALGLTHSAFEQRFVVDVATAETGDGWRCGRVREVRAHLGFTAMDVYIAREFAVGSCQYVAILEHERHHVEINREILRRHAIEFEQALRRLAAEVGALRTRSTAEAARRAADHIEEGLKPLFGTLDVALREANAQFDTSAEYWRLRRQCTSW